MKAKKLLENLIYAGKKRYAVRNCGRLQGQKNTPFQNPLATICKIVKIS